MSEWLEELGYIGVFLAAGLDGVFPIVPGESTVIAAAVLAAEGHLTLWLVILSGALGAIVGDSAAYRIGATGQGRFKQWIIRRLGDSRILAAEDLIQRRAWMLIIFGRFVPGLRTLTSVSAGMLGYPYRRFLPQSIVAGFLWATYAGCLGYFVADALDSPWLSLVVSLVASAAISFVLLYLERPRLRGLLRG